MVKRKKKTILVVLGGGGHTAEMLELVRRLGPAYDYEYVVCHNDRLSEQKLPYKGKLMRVYNPREKQDHVLPFVMGKFCVSVFHSFFLLVRSRSFAMMSSGAAVAVAPLLVGKLFFGKRIMYVETFSRIHKESLSAKLVYPFTDMFFVQWPELKKRFPRAIYAGRLL